MKLESLRLLYEPIVPTHAQELEDALCDSRVYEFITGHRPPSLEELFQAFTRKAAGSPSTRADEIWIDYAVRSKESGEAIGRVEGTILEGQAEVAYLFGPRHWGSGYAFESMRWLQQLLKSEFNVVDLWATVSEGNSRSIRLLARLGYHEPNAKLWPMRLLTFNEGDRIFYKSLHPVSNEA